MKLRVLWERSKWLLIAVVTAPLVALTWILGKALRFPTKPKNTPLPPLPANFREKTEEAEERAMVAKAQASAVADKDRQALSEISKIQDGSERRKRLAEFLKGL